MKGWAPHWVPCVRVDVPEDATPRQAFEATTAVEPLLRVVEQSVVGHVMVSVSARALEAFARHGIDTLVARLRKLASARLVELVGTAADDALLPLLPDREIRRQIELSDQAGKEAFGDVYSPWLLWPPSLACSPRLAHIAAEYGYTGMLVDEHAMRIERAPWTGDRVDTCAGLPGFFLLPSSRDASRAFAEGRITRHDGWRALGLYGEERRRYVITTFHVEPTRRPRALAHVEDLEISLRATELLEHFALGGQTAPLPSSSRSTENELTHGLPFATWHSPDNRVHALQWQLALRMLGAVEALQEAGLGPHPAVHALREAVDHGWRKSWWEAASAHPMDGETVVEGLRRREEAIAQVKALLPEETLEELAETSRALLEAVTGPVEQRAQAGYEPGLHP